MKKYSIISLIFIILVGLFTYINTNETTTFNMFGVNITLLNAVWSAGFLAIFYLISIFYFGIEKFKTFRFDRNIKKDKLNILQNIEAKLLYKNKLLEIKELKELEEFVEMINGDKIIFNKSVKFPVVNDLMKLQNNEEVDLKKYKLDDNNPWVLKNNEIKLKKGDKNLAKNLLNSPLKEEAIKILEKEADVKEILANNYSISKEIILNNLKSDRLKELIEKSDLTNEEYIEIAQNLYKITEIPETLLELFKNKITTYIYLLIEYEKIEEAMELAKDNDIKLFEYYILLRQNGIKIDIKEFLNAKL